MDSLDTKISIVGSGVFGLSTALHLKKEGYTDVTVYDYQEYTDKLWSPSKGCDGASSDHNKVFRATYGDEIHYQNLALKGREVWVEWNDILSKTAPQDLPKGLSPNMKLLEECGFLRLGELGHTKLSEYDQTSIDKLAEEGLRDSIFIMTDKEDRARLAALDEKNPSSNWVEKLDIFSEIKDETFTGFLDTSAGFTYADRGCIFAHWLCEKAGVKFVLGDKIGRLQSLVVEEGDEKKVSGLKTADGVIHKSDIVVVACGGWSPSLIPEVTQLLETTAGSVVTVKIPDDRPDLLKKYSPEHYPVFAYGLTGHYSPEFGGLYGFPQIDGKIKIGYRGRKWTNYKPHPKDSSKLVSTPVTHYSEPKTIKNLPLKALGHIKTFIHKLLPDLEPLGIFETRLCWYTDSVDNNFLIDFVPGYGKSLFICSGGSGHGYKFLPVLGSKVVTCLRGEKNDYSEMWKWGRDLSAHRNGLEDGPEGERVLSKLELATEEHWKAT